MPGLNPLSRAPLAWQDLLVVFRIFHFPRSAHDLGFHRQESGRTSSRACQQLLDLGFLGEVRDQEPVLAEGEPVPGLQGP